MNDNALTDHEDQKPKEKAARAEYLKALDTLNAMRSNGEVTHTAQADVESKAEIWDGVTKAVDDEEDSAAKHADSHLIMDENGSYVYSYVS